MPYLDTPDGPTQLSSLRPPQEFPEADARLEAELQEDQTEDEVEQNALFIVSGMSAAREALEKNGT